MRAREMRESLRVEVVLPFGVVGGAESTLLQLLTAAEARLDLSFIILGHGPLVERLRSRYGEPLVRPTGSGATSVGSAAMWLARRWKSMELDAVLANGVKAAAVAIPAARLASARVVWYKHDFSFDDRLAPLLARWADAVIANSNSVAHATKRTDVVVIPPPRPLPPYPPAEARSILEKKGLPPTRRPVVASIGRFVAYKGFDELIESLALPDARDWHLLVAGADDPSEPSERERLRTLSQRCGVSDRVTLLEHVTDIGRLLSGVDALAVVTRQDRAGFGREGFSRAATEGMAAGVPIIAATGGAVDERVAGAGIAVPPASPPQIAAALRQLLDHGTRRSLGDVGRVLERQHPNLAQCSARLASVLANTATRPGAGLRASRGTSVVTTVLNEGPAVDRLLDLLVPQLDPQDEVVVVDGGSSDDTAARIRARTKVDRRVRILEAPGSNISQGRNAGVRAARNDVIACTDAGCSPLPQWLCALKTSFEEIPTPALVAGVYTPSTSGLLQEAMAAACYPLVEEARRPRPLARAYGRVLGRAFDPTTPTGRSVAFTRDAWMKAGGFPEDLATAEDVSFGRAVAAKCGSCLLNTEAEVVWDQRATASATARMYFDYGAGGAYSGDSLLIGRDLLRAVSYLLLPAMIRTRRRSCISAVTALGVYYLSLPLVRSSHSSRRMPVALLVPFALALKDLSKAAGCVTGLMRRWRFRHGRGADCR